MLRKKIRQLETARAAKVRSVLGRLWWLKPWRRKPLIYAQRGQIRAQVENAILGTSRSLGIGTEQFRRFARLFRWSAQMPSKNERVELEMKIMKARQCARDADDKTRERLEALAAELEQKLREIDE
jgi:hypothetical protein